MNNAFLNLLDWNDATNALCSHDWRQFKNEIDDCVDPLMGELEWMHPMALAVKANSADNPKWHEAMNGPDADGFW